MFLAYHQVLAAPTGDPYDEALALHDRADVDSLQRAIVTLERLGDNCLLRQKLRALDVRSKKP